MATEGPLIHDGSQTTANSNLSGPAASNPGGTGAALAGQNDSGQFLVVKLVGARLVDLVTANSDAVYGVLQNKPATGQAADVGIAGVTKLTAGGTIAAGNAVMAATTGVAVVATSTFAFAVALEAAVAGDIFTARITNIN
jgi:hypothetical protein